MRRRRVWLAVTFVLCVVAAWAVPLVCGKPWSIRQLYMRILVEALWESPELCSTLHLMDWRSDQLDSASVAHRQQKNELMARELATLRRYDRASMSEPERTSYDVMEFYLDASGGADSGRGWSPYAIEQLGGVHVSFPDFMTRHHEVHSRRDAERYVLRLERSGAQFDEAIATAEDDAARGVIPPRFILELVVTDAVAFAAHPPAESPLVTSFETKLRDAPGLDAATRKVLLDRAIRAVEQVVKPAYARYVAATKALAERATDDAGLWHTRGGEARYTRYLRAGMSSDLSPDEVHAMGLAEVDRVEGLMRQTLDAMHVTAESPAAAVRQLQLDPLFGFPQTDEGRKTVLARYQAILDDISAKLDRVSHIPLPAPMKVEPVPAFKELTAPGAYYEAPPLDGSQLGAFVVNLGIPQFSYGMRTLAYHEGVPGHHYQIMVARAQKDLPLFRQLLPFNSYTEGWALWAEQVASDTGFEDDPHDRLGFLSEQLLRAARLVVDSGIHAKRWTRDQARAYFAAHTTASMREVQIEIDRYVVWPGQACGYMVGKKTIERLAEKAKAVLGERYSLQEFDDVVLGAGAVPMPVLERVVGRWLEGRR